MAVRMGFSGASSETEDVEHSNDISYTLDNPSRHKYEVWKGWTIGSYVHVWRPAHACGDPSCGGRRWRNHPALLVDIWKEPVGDAQFVVAHLYNRDTASQQLQQLTGCSWWRALVSLWSWPRESTYVLSNHFELVYAWEIRIWLRSVPPSIATCRAIDIRTYRLAKCEFPPETDIGRALNTKFDFPHFMQLPRELRDDIYSYALRDEGQNTSRSRIYTYSLLRKRQYDDRGWTWYRELLAPTLGPLPKLQTPGLLRSCSQLRQEALESIHRTKTFVITITSLEDSFVGLDQEWLPDMCDFLRIRLDLILSSIEVGTVRGCLHRLAGLLEERALSLQLLEVRIALSYSEASTGIRHHAFPPELSCKEVAEGMREFAYLHRRRGRSDSAAFKPLQISWGVQEAEKRAGDYSCECTYLRARFLHQIWSRICNEGEDNSEKSDLVLEQEACQDMGCKLHRY